MSDKGWFVMRGKTIEEGPIDNGAEATRIAKSYTGATAQYGTVDNNDKFSSLPVPKNESKASAVVETMKHLLRPQAPKEFVSEDEDPVDRKLKEMEKTYGSQPNAIVPNEKPIVLESHDPMNEWFAGKEEFLYFETLAKRQVKIFTDSADHGVLLTADPNDSIRTAARKNLMALMKLHGYKLEKFSYGSLTKMFIPIEMDGDFLSGVALTVSFSNMKNKVWLSINIENKTLSNAIAKSQYGYNADESAVYEDPFDITLLEGKRTQGAARSIQLQLRTGSKDGSVITDEQLDAIVEKLSGIEFPNLRVEIITQIKR